MREALRAAHPLIQLVVLIVLGFVAMGLLASVVTVTMMALGYDASVLLGSKGLSDPNSVAVLTLKLLQMAQAVGLFIAPYLIYRYYIGSPGYSTSLSKVSSLVLALFGITMIFAMPTINWLADWNAGLHLPSPLEGIEAWMRSTERDAEVLIKTFLTMDSGFDLMFNLLLIAVLPAIGEEFFFRGMMQPLFQRSVGNAHLAIWLTAFVFSFFHMQFLGFFPRLLIGVVFGYAAHWTGSLVVPIVGHFLNNGLAVVMTWYLGVEAIDGSIETLGANEGEGLFVLMSLALTAGGLYLLWRMRDVGATYSSQ